jgi:AbrB family looped-hinge helix DNA binding protein
MNYSYLRWFWLFESESVIGERGQVTIPKIIREKKNLVAGEKVVFKIEGDKIIMEKNKIDKKEKERLMKEYYTKFAKENEELSEEIVGASSEVVLNDD